MFHRNIRLVVGTTRIGTFYVRRSHTEDAPQAKMAFAKLLDSFLSSMVKATKKPRLDLGSNYHYILLSAKSKDAAGQGLEPQSLLPESSVLPLHHPAKKNPIIPKIRLFLKNSFPKQFSKRIWLFCLFENLP